MTAALPLTRSEAAMSAAAADAGRTRLSFDVVIATCNRPQALALSIPLILAQSRLPERLIVIDSSDDHAPVAAMVAQTTVGWPGQVIVEQAARGLPYQRNRGLTHVQADVVIFPDDDSLFHPGTSEAILEAYERDTTCAVAGVCAAPVNYPPSGTLPEGTYAMTAAHRRDAKNQRLRNRIEKMFSHAKPVLYLGQVLRAHQIMRQPLPAWLVRPDYSLVEYMTGFRMSFRTALIKEVGFDSAMSGYALSEDVDASLAVARQGLLVGALQARVYHHRFPGGRPDPYVWGVITVLNRAYVVLKHAADGGLSEPEARAARSRLVWFMRLKLLTTVPAALRSPAGRARFRGAWDAAKEARGMLDLPQAELSAVYRAACKRLGL